MWPGPKMSGSVTPKYELNGKFKSQKDERRINEIDKKINKSQTIRIF